MKFLRPDDVIVEHSSISFCGNNAGCNECPIGDKVRTQGESCAKWVIENPERAAELMGYTLVDGTTSTENKNNEEKTFLEKHKSICDELNELYDRKNRDYGDSFHHTYLEEGMAMVRIRLSDKLSRFKKLTKTGESKVKDESVRDTLIDLANYAIMAIIEIDNEKENHQLP